ncbi:MAG: hypothetical protein AAFU85_05010 [Planctomycetota bacterium]
MATRITKFSIANVLMLMIVVALGARVALDSKRIANLEREVALYDAVERQRFVVDQRKLELEAIINQTKPQAELQSLYRWVGANRVNLGQQITSYEITPLTNGLRRQKAKIRNAELRLRSEQAILRDKEQKLKSRVEGRAPRT